MHSKHKNVTVTWQSRGVAGWNRLSISRTAIFLLGGLFFGSWLATLAAGALAAHLHRDKAGLYALVEELENERSSLTAQLEAVQAEMVETREAIARVRAEERKIRSWLGLEKDSLDGPTAGGDTDGGKGSIGDVSLRAVDPRDRDTEAEPAAGTGTLGIGYQARSLGVDLSELAARVQERKKQSDSVPAISPVDGEHWISSAFGWRKSPFTGKREFHSGVDMAGRKGTPIVAAADGVVLRVLKDAALGRAVTVDHGNGIQTVYGHLDKALVKRRQKVKRGESIGKMGSTGKRTTGPHLHFAVRVDDKYVNPWSYMLDRSKLAYPVAKK